MSDILAELDEAMRQERLKKFWDENGNFIIFIIVGTILMTGIFSAYNAWKDSREKAQTSALITTLEAGTTTQADQTQLGALSAIANLSAASKLAENGQTQDAITLYKTVAENTKNKEEYRDLATLSAIRLSLTQETPDLNTLLETLNAIKENSPYAPQISIEKAALHYALGNQQDAIQSLNKVLEQPDLPPSLYVRAQNLKHIYGLKEE